MLYAKKQRKTDKTRIDTCADIRYRDTLLKVHSKRSIIPAIPATCRNSGVNEVVRAERYGWC
jgi:hypothetical protein